MRILVDWISNEVWLTSECGIDSLWNPRLVKQAESEAKDHKMCTVEVQKKNVSLLLYHFLLFYTFSLWSHLHIVALVPSLFWTWRESHVRALLNTLVVSGRLTCFLVILSKLWSENISISKNVEFCHYYSPPFKLVSYSFCWLQVRISRRRREGSWLISVFVKIFALRNAWISF